MAFVGELCNLIVLENQKGLHARAAAKFVRVLESYQVEVTVTKDDVTVSGHSIMGLMMLAAPCGTQLKVCVSGEDALKAMDALIDLVKRKFDED